MHGPVHAVFGPTEDSYLLLVGRRFVHSNTNPQIVDLLSGTSLDPTKRIGWIRVHSDGKSWFVKDNLSGQFIYDEKTIAPEILAYFRETQKYGHIGTFSFEIDGVGMFSRPITGEWQSRSNSNWSTQNQEIAELRNIIPTFDSKLRLILYGKAGRIYSLDSGWHAELRGDANIPGHPLYDALKEFADGNWLVVESTSLSLYDSRYFFLEFRQPGSTSSRMKWNFPPLMQKWMAELINLQESPEEKAGLDTCDQQYAILEQNQLAILRGQAVRQESQWQVMQNIMALQASRPIPGLSLHQTADGGAIYAPDQPINY